MGRAMDPCPNADSRGRTVRLTIQNREVSTFMLPLCNETHIAPLQLDDAGGKLDEPVFLSR
jgi:hypothetical protein